MNHSLYGADRLTHLKIVVVAIIGATVVAGVGIAARDTSTTPGVLTARNLEMAPVMRAGQPVVISGRDISTVR